MITALSPEGKIIKGLDELNCSWSSFAKISGIMGRTRLNEALSDIPGKALSHQDAVHLLEILEELRELQTAVDKSHGVHVPIDFSLSRADEIQSALVIRRLARVAAEQNDNSFDGLAAQATKHI
jgi:hypothetical protein